MPQVARLLDWPPLWLAAFLLLAAGLSQVWQVPIAGLQILGQGMVVLAVGLMVAAAAQMFLAKTTVIPRRKPQSLVTTGVFSYSRNPIYLADAILLAGAILWMQVIWALPLVVGFAWITRKRFIEAEEATLTAAFGPEYDLWRQKTQRWFGRG